LNLGLGAGWQEREHNNYGFDLLDINDRFDRFEEGMQVITKLLQSDQPVDFSGEYYRLQDGILLPHPQRPGGPPILIGGNGLKRTLPLTAHYAKEWNALMVTPDRFAELNHHLDDLLAAEGRKPDEVKRSMMVGCIYADNEDQLNQRVADRTHGERTAEELRQRGVIVGTANQMVAQLAHLEEVGLQRVMLQWIDLDDIDGLEAIAQGVVPQLPS
jgi:alkanesulfonate monooxygenase SsuD/methylene tetrahydromethanopterin reductase-like flavin-dependent oxidoreductase (luciferase family)